MTLAMIVLASLEANCKILVMVVLGVIATFKGVFDSKGISDLGRLVYHITLPALLFSKILQEFSLERVHVVYWLPVFCALHSIAAFLISRLLGCLLRISTFELRVVMGERCGARGASHHTAAKRVVTRRGPMLGVQRSVV